MKNTTFKTCLWLYVFSVVICLAFFYFYLGASHLKNLDVDEQYYYQNALKIVEGNYSLDVYRPLGFPAILAAILYVTNKNLIATQILVLLFGCLKTPLTYLLAQRMIGSRPVSLLSGLLTALWPPFIFFSLSFYSETFAIACFLLVLLLIPKGSYLSTTEKKSVLAWFIPGALLAISSWIHPIYIAFVPFAILIIFIEEKYYKAAFKHSTYFLAALFLTLLPMSAYISYHKGSFVLISQNEADAIAGGLNPTLIERGYQVAYSPDGRKTWEGPGTWIPDHGYLSKDEEDLPIDIRNDLIWVRLTAWVLNHPLDALYLQTAKLLNMWGFFPLLISNPERFIFGNIPIIIVFILSVFSLFIYRKDYRTLARFWVLPLFVSSVAMISWGSWRFRQPADIGLFVLSSLLLCSFYRKKP